MVSTEWEIQPHEAKYGTLATCAIITFASGLRLARLGVTGSSGVVRVSTRSACLPPDCGSGECYTRSAPRWRTRSMEKGWAMRNTSASAQARRGHEPQCTPRHPPGSRCIAVDFEHQRREEVIQYIYATYGRDRAAITGVVVTYCPNSAIRDVGKARGCLLRTPPRSDPAASPSSRALRDLAGAAQRRPVCWSGRPPARLVRLNLLSVSCKI